MNTKPSSFFNVMAVIIVIISTTLWPILAVLWLFKTKLWSREMFSLTGFIFIGLITLSWISITIHEMVLEPKRIAFEISLFFWIFSNFIYMLFGLKTFDLITQIRDRVFGISKHPLAA